MSSLMERLKNNRGKQASALKESAKKKGGYQKDERIWKYSGVDTDKLTDKGKKQQYSKSVIRFLPIPIVDMNRQEAGELAEHQVLSPIVSVSRHNFNKGGKYYNELSRGMLGEECPVNEYDRAAWGAWKEAGKPDDEVKKTLVGRLPKDEYYANILVIEDLANPDNNGKQFLFKFGQGIMNMINEAMEPSMPGKDPIDPFDFLEGHNLTLEFMMPEQKFGNWTGFAPKDIPKESSWDKEPSPIADTDERIEEIMTTAYSLTEFNDIKLFKPFDQLQKRLYEVLGVEAPQEESNTDVKAQSGKGSDNSSVPNQKVKDADEGDLQSSGTPSEPKIDMDEEMDEFERMLNES